MSLNKTYFLFFFFIHLTFGIKAQSDSEETPCYYTVYGIVETIEDSIEFYIEYTSEIDLSEENCSYTLAEDYYNIAPNMQTNTLCVIYINDNDTTTKYPYLEFFDNHDILKDDLDKIQLVFITDRRTGLWKAYETKEEIENVFYLDIRKGIPKEE